MSDDRISTEAVSGAEGVLSAARQSQAQGLRAWGRVWDAYTEYVLALAKARTPAAVFEANAGLLRDAFDAFRDPPAGSRPPQA